MELWLIWEQVQVQQFATLPLSIHLILRGEPGIILLMKIFI
jgi:hypothetical protein